MESAPEVESTPREGGSRRELLLGLGLIGVAAAACGGEDDPQPAAVQPSAEATTAPATSPAATSEPAAAGGKALGKAADIPVGGGMIFKDQKIVVTQPTKGTFKAFSAVCQHAGCTVGEVADKKIICPCHGSEYAAATGAVVKGPATKGLPAKKIKVTGGEIEIIP